jgi:hypothetical protein
MLQYKSHFYKLSLLVIVNQPGYVLTFVFACIYLSSVCMYLRQYKVKGADPWYILYVVSEAASLHRIRNLPTSFS